MKKDKQITLDYQEFLDMQSELDSLRKPAEGTELSEVEHQEATGILLVRCLQNPEIFRRASAPIDLGKYKAIFMVTQLLNSGMSGPSDVRVKFERN